MICNNVSFYLCDNIKLIHIYIYIYIYAKCMQLITKKKNRLNPILLALATLEKSIISTKKSCLL